MAKKTLSREAKKHSNEINKGIAAKKPVVKLPEKAPEKTPEKKPEKKPEVEAPQQEVSEPIAEAVTEKPKRVRFVREKKVKAPEMAAAPLPPRSSKVRAKMMSKNLSLPPKTEPNFGSAPKP
jgi:hypothetical protein